MISKANKATRKQAYALLKNDAAHIYQLIEVQLKDMTIRHGSIYEDILNTQTFGLAEQIDFAIRLNLIDKKDGKTLLENLEVELHRLGEAVINAS